MFWKKQGLKEKVEVTEGISPYPRSCPGKINTACQVCVDCLYSYGKSVLVGKCPRNQNNVNSAQQ